MISVLYNELGIKTGHHIMMHSSFRKVRSAFPGITIEKVIRTLQNQLTDEGSLIMPSFTYCFKRKNGDYQVYCSELTQSRTGAITEYFRQLPGIVRTSSPTHSFLLSGYVKKNITWHNSPESPLGEGSVLEWLAGQNSYILLLGTDFTSLSFGHYLETAAPVPWSDISPWDYLDVEKIGVSITGEQKLKEVPGCAKQFKIFQEYLQGKRKINVLKHNELEVFYIPVKLLLEEGIHFFRNHYDKLLCPEGKCVACDSRAKSLNIR